MKNSRLTILPLLFTFIALLLSCSEEGTYDNHYSLSPESFFEILQMPEVFDGEGGRDTIRIKTNLPWKAVPNETWMTVSPSSGVGSAIVTVTSDKNELPELRAGEIVFGNRLWLDKNSSADEVNDMLGIVTIKQSPTLTFSLSADTLFFTPQSDRKSVSITSNLSWEASTRVYWFTLSKTSGEGDGTLVVEATENTSIEKREGTITFKSLAGFSTLTVVQEGVEPVFEVDPDTLSFTYKNTSAVLTVTSNQSWKVSTDDSWLSLSSTGDMYGPIVSVQATENTTSTSREGAVTFTAGDSTYVVPVTQAARTLSVDTENLNFTSAGGSQTITVEGDSPFDVTSDANWLTLDIRGTSVVVKAAANTSITEREALIIVSASGLTEGTISQTITVTQEAAAPIFSVTPTSASFTSSGGSKTLTVTSNQAWTVSSDASWLTLSETSGTGDATLTISATANTSINSRSGTITFKAGGTFYTVSISQDGTAATFGVTPTSAEFSAEGGSKSLTVTSNQTWTASASASWILLSNNSGNGNATLTITASANTSIEERSGEVSFEAGGVYYTVSVTQAGATPTFSVTPTSASFTSSGGSVTLTITSNQSWTASTSATWLSLSNDSGSGDATLTVTAEANTSTSSRTEAIAFTAGGTSYRVSVTQEGATPTFSVTPTSASFTSSGGNKTLTITSNQSWTASADASWLTLSETSGTGDATLTISATANTSINSRSGTITFKAGGTSYTVNISQDGTAATFGVTPTSAEFSAEGGSKSLTVTSNQTWTASASASWILLSNNSGNGNATLTVTASANTSIEGRSGGVTFEAGGVSYTVSITQSGATPTFSVTPTSAEFTAAGGSNSFSVKSNQSWTASANANWISLSADSGNGNATLMVTVSANTSSDVRSGEVTFSAGETTYPVTITQEGFEKKPYLSFEALENTTFTFSINDLQYSLDNGLTWTTLPAETTSPTIQAGDRIMWKASGLTPQGLDGIGTFTSTGKYNVEGNIMSLLYGDDFIGKTSLNGYDLVFDRLFSSCIQLVNAKDLILPATTLSLTCYYQMFLGCTGLTTAPALPATTLANCCYQEMFAGCTSLTAAPALPATTLAQTCYYQMFYGCTSLTTAPELPATSLTNYCYQEMFTGCTGLSSAPALPATTMTLSCYSQMFRRCTSLTTAPALPATTLADACYNEMFYDCANLTTPPALPATVLADRCYCAMFFGCSNLSSAPELPATTLNKSCYNSMFYGCTSLTAAPDLPATNLVDYCYYQMFYGCNSLNYIKCLAINKLGEDCTKNWVYGVSSTGTFVKSALSSWSTGLYYYDGIPNGWTVQDEGTTNEHEFVDLGLPSGLLWATCNVGANSPEEYGDYFAWGETEPKSIYSWSTYKWCNGSQNTLTKYNTKSEYGVVDQHTSLFISDDAAHANWGGEWRMPTGEEWIELQNNCNWTWDSSLGIVGYIITSYSNGKSIFLPAAGYYKDNECIQKNYAGYYWYIQLDFFSYQAYKVNFNTDNALIVHSPSSRALGHSIRPVREQ